MLLLIAYSVIHDKGTFVSSVLLETSLLHESDVARRHIENWQTVRIPALYTELSTVSVRVLSFRSVQP